MYSLYRAWLSLGPCPMPPMAPLNLSTPGGGGVGAGGAGGHHQHHHQTTTTTPDVTLHVGPSLTQFSAHRAVLSTHSGYFKAALINNAQEPIAVPNVNVDEFSSLLTFMYTGYLDLNLSNIYNILLATHILHMPRALEICRSFLLQTQQQNHQHQQQSTLDLSQQSRPSIIKPIPSKKPVLATQQILAPTFSNLQKSESTPFKTVEKEPQASTSKVEHLPPPQHPPPVAVTTTMAPQARTPKPTKLKKSSSDKVIIDIACCDGPVRFHRVINKNYGRQVEKTAYEIDEETKSAALNKAMNENIREQLDENHKNEMFTCLYCNHTFKSQYCYQKHARRHLNPVNLTETNNKPKESSSSSTSSATNNKREFKLLDMNVQYYPCKTCGSKFPSYYFVHKHRKLCHAEEMADNTNKNNEMVPENTGGSTSNNAISNNNNNNNNNAGSDDSAIDVEAVQNDC